MLELVGLMVVVEVSADPSFILFFHAGLQLQWQLPLSFAAVVVFCCRHSSSKRRADWGGLGLDGVIWCCESATLLFGAGKLIVVNLELSAGRHTHSKNPDGLGERLWVVGGGLGLGCERVQTKERLA